MSDTVLDRTATFTFGVLSKRGFMLSFQREKTPIVKRKSVQGKKLRQRCLQASFRLNFSLKFNNQVKFFAKSVLRSLTSSNPADIRTKFAPIPAISRAEAVIPRCVMVAG